MLAKFVQKSSSQLLLLSPQLSCCCTQQSHAGFHNKYRKRPSKFSGYGFLPTVAVKQQIQRKVERTFTRETFKRFGLGDLENLKFMLATRGTNFRYLDAGKRKQLTTIFMNALPNLVAAEKALENVLVTKIELPANVFSQIRVFWRCSGDLEKDRVIKERLEEHEEVLRKELQEMFHNLNMPPLKFVEDRGHLVNEEMNKLFEMADYGMDYRAFSRAGQALTPSTPPPVEEREKERTPPRWLESWRKRIRANQPGKDDGKT